ncbi:MAG TPA: TetR/AcrR family transcriptional regulator C-terminal domain-containing protein, partial [Chitinophagaceae bacterium]|nr:TetR/AcrR family transcriptional regulator C-terminal domain-containing protein [Chitinophagaceae bacterium]
ITSRQISLVQDEDTIELLINIKKTNQSIIEDIIKEGQEKKIFREVNIPLTIGSVFGTISQVSMSQEYYKKVLKEKNEEAYFRKLRPKLKRHLKTLIRNHLALKG